MDLAGKWWWGEFLAVHPSPTKTQCKSWAASVTNTQSSEAWRNHVWGIARIGAIKGFQPAVPACDSCSAPEEDAGTLNAGHVKFNRCCFHLLGETEGVTCWPMWEPCERTENDTCDPKGVCCSTKQENPCFVPVTHPRCKLDMSTLLFC